MHYILNKTIFETKIKKSIININKNLINDNINLYYIKIYIIF